MNILDMLNQGPVLGDGGALFELERRGYISAGPFTPEVVVEFPEAVRSMQIDFARAGSQVIQALTYYAHEEKLKAVGKQGALGEINENAVRIAREAAADYGCRVAGGLSNTWVFDPKDEASFDETRRQFDRQIELMAPHGVEFFIAETIEYLGEALIALDSIRAAGLPSVITMGFKYQDKTLDGYPLEEAFKRLEDHGADVVGINCFRDPNRMLPFLRRARSAVSCHLAAQPVAYRCTDQRPYFQIQRYNDEPAFPLNLDPFVLTRSEMADFAAQARDAGINYIGGCCGTAPHHLRAMAETLGIAAPNSRWSPHMELHPIMGGDEHIREKDERILCEQRFGAAHCHFMRKSGEGQD